MLGKPDQVIFVTSAADDDMVDVVDGALNALDKVQLDVILIDQDHKKMKRLAQDRYGKYISLPATTLHRWVTAEPTKPKE